MGELRRLPDPLDRGRLLTPGEVADKVRRLQGGTASFAFLTAGQVVVHPMVFEDCILSGHSDFAFTFDSPLNYTCRGLSLRADPDLRFDEVRFRHEQVL